MTLRAATLTLAALALAACASPGPRAWETGVQRAAFARDRTAPGALEAWEVSRAAGRETVVATLGDVFFETGSAALSPEGLVRVAEIAALLAAEPGQVVLVEGAADPRGRADANLRLSVERAETVALRLLADGVPTERIVFTGVGAPAVAPASLTADQLRGERRVVISRLASG